MNSACEEVLSVIDSLPTLKELRANSSRTAAVKACVETFKLSCRLAQNEAKFLSFCTMLLETIGSALEKDPNSPLSAQKEKMWVQFGVLRQHKLPELWKSFLRAIGCDAVAEEPLFMELVNEVVFERMIKSRYIPAKITVNAAPPSLTVEEENIIRYACGYVGMKLHNRYIKQHGDRAAEFVDCIDSMNVKGVASSCLDYTREWVDKVNRGGLFCVGDDAYNLFVSIEIAMQSALINHIRSSYKMSVEESHSKKEMIVEAVMKEEEVQHYWRILSIDISTEKDALELLRDIVELWLTIRGFAISKS